MTGSLAARVYDACHLKGEFILRSGLQATDYFDKYRFESDPVLLLDVARAMVDLLPPCDVLAGMEMGGIPVVTAVSMITGLPAVFVRKKPKTYGTCKAVEGIDVAGCRVVAIEDVVTTAGALVEGCQRLRQAGATVDAALCAIDREQGGADALAGIGVRLGAAVGRAELDPHGRVARRRSDPGGRYPTG